MSGAWGFYADAGLTVPGAGGVVVASNATHVDRELRFGSPVAGKTLQAAADPGVAPIQIIPADDAVGSGIEASAMRLALSPSGLNSATPGGALTIGTTLVSGAGNAVVFYARTARGSLGIGVYPDLKIDTTSVIEG